jgi:L-seryl-tRNA(Ser) seleniumtransferase
MGADLVCFSGGKAIGGPQASGILAGRADLVASALAQQLDMDIRAEGYSPPPLLGPIFARGIPQHGIGRGYKAGKEEILGLLVALDRFAAGDDAADVVAYEARLRGIAGALAGLNSVRTELVGGGRTPVLAVMLDSPVRASEAVRRLGTHDPKIHVGERRVGDGTLFVDPQSLLPEDDALLARALRSAVS